MTRSQCWGYNAHGSLGDGTTTTRSTPVDTGLRDAVIVKMNKYEHVHTKVLTSDGTLYAWGSNYNCQLGDGTKTNRYSPKDVSLASGYKVISIGMGGMSTHIGTADGAVMAWGANTYGQVMDGHLLDPTPEYRKTPPPLMDKLSPHLASD